MKGFSSKHITLKVDVIGAENILFAGASVHLSERTSCGSDGVKGPRKAVLGCKGTSKIDPIMQVLCIT